MIGGVKVGVEVPNCMGGVSNGTVGLDAKSLGCTIKPPEPPKTVDQEWSVEALAAAVAAGAGGFLELYVNDSMKFKFNSWKHDLWLFPDKASWDACEFQGAVKWAAALDDGVGFGKNSPGYLKQFTETGDYHLGCAISNLCSFGMKQLITVIDPCP